MTGDELLTSALSVREQATAFSQKHWLLRVGCASLRKEIAALQDTALNMPPSEKTNSATRLLLAADRELLLADSSTSLVLVLFVVVIVVGGCVVAFGL